MQFAAINRTIKKLLPVNDKNLAIEGKIYIDAEC